MLGNHEQVLAALLPITIYGQVSDPETMSEEEETHFEVPARPAAVREARDAVHKVMADWGFSAIADDLVLCLSEALTNSITYAVHGGTVTVLAWHNAAMVRVEVEDGDSTPPSLTVPAEVFLPGPLTPEHELSVRGRGLYLIEELASRWGVADRPPGKAVWFEVDTEPRIGAAG